MTSKKKELNQDFEEQYYILKEEEQEEYNKKIVTLIILTFLILIVSLAGTAMIYYNTRKSDSKDIKPQIVNKINMLTIDYQDGNKFEIKNQESGWKSSKIISVKNEGDLNISYRLVWDSVINNLKEKDDFVVTVKRNGAEIIIKEALPTVNKDIFSMLEIEPNKTHQYEIVFEYLKNEEKEQLAENDFSTTIQVVMETTE